MSSVKNTGKIIGALFLILMLAYSLGAFLLIDPVLNDPDYLLRASEERNRVILGVILVCLALAPFLFPGVRTVDTAARICVFIVLVASYDLLLGYGGIVSFAHTMFFGIGAYGVALASTHMGRGFDAIFVGALAGTGVAAALALLIGLFSLRVRAIFFAMITLAVASAVAVLVSQLSGLTGGEDGLTFQTPRALGPAFKFGGAFDFTFSFFAVADFGFFIHTDDVFTDNNGNSADCATDSK